jgi:Cd2+/Zn2+-exporting ATPase
LMNDDLERLPFLIELGRKAMSVVHQNLLFGVFFITVSLILSGLGAITPVFGALLHLVAALVVVFNSARLVRFGEELHHENPATARQPEPRVEAVPAA